MRFYKLYFNYIWLIKLEVVKRCKRKKCVCVGGGGIVGYFDFINILKLGKEVLLDMWYSFLKWGDGKLRKKRYC